MRRAVVGDRIRILSWDKMAEDHRIDLDGNLVFACSDGDSYFTHGNKEYCGKEFSVGAIYDDGAVRLALINLRDPDLREDFNPNAPKVIYLHPEMFEFVDPVLKAGMTVRIREREDLESRYGTDYSDIYIEEDRCDFVHGMDYLCGTELVLESDVVYDRNHEQNVNNFVTLIPDDEGNKWIITAGMVEVVSTVEAPDVDFGEDFMKALGVA